MQKKIWVHDHEVFSNFFSSTFRDKDTDEIRIFYVHNEVNEIDKFIDFIENEVSYLVGYNNSKYDDIITNYILQNKRKILTSEVFEITNEIFDLSKDIIDSQRKGNSIYNNSELKKLLFPKNSPYKSLDLMSLMAFDKNYVTLKQACIAMRWHKVQDLPKPFNEPVDESEVDTILLYNINDVDATKRLLQIVIEEVRIRFSIGDAYNVNVLNKSRSGIGDVLMKKLWEEETSKPYSYFKDTKTERSYIDLKTCISDKVQFESENLKNLLESIKSTTWTPGSSFKKTVIINNSKYDILLGGLHSSNPPMIVESTNTHKIIDLDFGSYYPNLMINLEIYPEHLSKRFLNLFKRIVNQRLEAKAQGNKIVADALKIVINSVKVKYL